MKIIFNDKFYNSDYVNDSASVPGRMEAIINTIKQQSQYEIISNEAADYKDILRVHQPDYIETIKKNDALYQMALLSAGAAIKAAQSAFNGDAAFACLRPPGHHAYISSGWGYCYFCNMAIALKKLRDEGKISSAFILDFDAHTGDGTINCLKDWKEVIILNPWAEDRDEYFNTIENCIKNINSVDIIAVCAGFDSYELDVGKKLKTFDFYKIGRLMKLLAKRLQHNRRFAILEGGYYQQDLGKNVLSFCQGFE